MATATSIRDLRVFQLAIQLASDVYQMTGDLPAADRSDLAANLQRLAVVIPTLLGNGHKSGKRTVFRTACLRALERLNELETLLIVCGELHPGVPTNDTLDQVEDVRQAIVVIVKKLSPDKPAAKKV